MRNLRSWNGSLDENQEGITDLHTDSIFASPASEVTTNITRKCKANNIVLGVQTPRQGGSGILVYPRLPL